MTDWTKLLDAAKALRERAGSPRASSGTELPPLLLLTDAARLPDPVAAVRRLPPGCGMVLRHYGAPGRRVLALRLAAECRRREILFLVGADAALAADTGADGVHLPARLPAQRVRSGEWRLTTASAHSAEELRRAAAAGVDAALVSAVFPTPSHPHAKPLGPAGFADLVSGSPLPVYALGGVTDATCPAIRESGASGIAAVGAFARPAKGTTSNLSD